MIDGLLEQGRVGRDGQSRAGGGELLAEPCRVVGSREDGVRVGEQPLGCHLGCHLGCAGVNIHKDLHPQQRGFQGFHNGALMLDGWFFSAQMPKHLWELPGTTLNSTRAEREAIHLAHDKRLREWGYLSLGPVQADGSQRLQDPARRGIKRCPNYGPSMRLNPSKYDDTGCTPGEDCACGRTVAVTRDLQERMRQPHVWMTTPWAAAYYRRNLV